jgi:hypothetical protein
MQVKQVGLPTSVKGEKRRFRKLSITSRAAKSKFLKSGDPRKKTRN